MASKVIFSIFMVLLVCSAKAHKLNDISDDVTVALKKLGILINDSIDAAQVVVNKEQDTLVDMANSTINSAESYMDKCEENYLTQLDATKQRAREAGKDIDDCLGDNEKNLTNISSDFAADLNECVNSTVTEGFTYVQKCLDDLNGYVDDISKIEQQAKDCGKGFRAFPCLSKLLLQIGLESTSLPVKIGANAASAAADIAQLSLKVDSCKTEKTARWTEKGDAELAEIKECVADSSTTAKSASTTESATPTDSASTSESATTTT